MLHYKITNFQFFIISMFSHALNANFSVFWLKVCSSLWMPQGNVWVMESTISKQSLQFQKLKPPICCSWQCQLLRTELIKIHSRMLILFMNEEEVLHKISENDWCLPSHKDCLSYLILIDEFRLHVEWAAGAPDSLTSTTSVFYKGKAEDSLPRFLPKRFSVF